MGTGGGTGAGGSANPAVCTPAASTEMTCGDGRDDDCDGRIDCMDTDCEGKTCGASGLVCTAGACIAPDIFPKLPAIANVHATVRGDTATVSFDPVDGARDYRIYPLPAKGDVMSGEGGALVVKNAIYRCGGDRQFYERDGQYAFPNSLSGDAFNYNRKESEAVLGYVYKNAGPGRVPVYRMADPNGATDGEPPSNMEFNSADYVTDADHTRLLAAGFRDDGIAFYVPEAASATTRPIYRMQYAPEPVQHRRTTVFYTDGLEHDARAKSDPKTIEDQGVRFQVLAATADGAVALHRVYYAGGHNHDVLAAGEAYYDRVLHQGNRPVWFLSWPGLTAKTTLVVEALDQGCPFPGGYVGFAHAPGNPAEGHYPTLTMDEARLPTSETFLNGQFDPMNRPKPTARAFVDAEPAPAPKMDWFEGFETTKTWEPLKLDTEGNGFYYYRNSSWFADFTWCTENNAIGPVLGELLTGQGDGGAGCHLRITPRTIAPKIAGDTFLHVTMESDVPSTGRRYPQILITTVQNVELGTIKTPNMTPIQERLADGSTIIVQPFGDRGSEQGQIVELQLEFCDHFHWNVNAQCNRANITGHKVGVDSDTAKWLPVPVLGEVAGYDRRVKLDVYASTDRVYLFADDKPAGCGVLPAGKMPAGDVTVAFGSVIYHSGIDESVTDAKSPQQYLHRYSLSHTDRHFDNLGIELKTAAPKWDDQLLPCGTQWYGGSQ
jgi:hypothetical protein